MLSAQADKPAATAKAIESPEERTSDQECLTITKQAWKQLADGHESMQAAALRCLKHWKDFKNALPLDRLIQGAPASYDKQPLVFWVKQNSPIHWVPGPKDKDGNSTQQVKVYQPGDKNFKPLNMKQAERVPYYATPEAMKRAATTLEPLSAAVFFSRIVNMPKQLANTLKDDSKRDFDDSYGDDKFTKQFLDGLLEYIAPWQEKAERKHKAWLKQQADLKSARGERRLIEQNAQTQPKPPVQKAQKISAASSLN